MFGINEKTEFFYFLTEKEIAKVIAKRFKDKRLLYNFTQEYVAKQAGITIYKVRDFEQSGKIPFIDLIKILKVVDGESALEQFLKIDTYITADIMEKINKLEAAKRKRASKKEID